MAGMSFFSTRRPRRMARLAALASAVLHLALAAGATHDVEVHRLEAAARLPEAFHHHDFSLAERGSDVGSSIVNECLACHLSRQVPTLVAPTLLPGATPATLTGRAAASPAPPNRIAPSPRVTRGPPAPTV
jgi:hypothetical protein